MKILKTADVTPGMEVAAYSPRYDWETKFGKVLRTTPSGQIVVDIGSGAIVRFDKHGSEIGAPGYRKYRYLAPAQDVRDQKALVDARKHAANAINKIYQEMEQVREWSPESMLNYIQGIQQQLINAKTCVLEYQELDKALNPEKKDE
jgi:hypothetical protein